MTQERRKQQYVDTEEIGEKDKTAHSADMSLGSVIFKCPPHFYQSGVYPAISWSLVPSLDVLLSLGNGVRILPDFQPATLSLTPERYPAADSHQSLSFFKMHLGDAVSKKRYWVLLKTEHDRRLDCRRRGPSIPEPVTCVCERRPSMRTHSCDVAVRKSRTWTRGKEVWIGLLEGDHLNLHFYIFGRCFYAKQHTLT